MTARVQQREKDRQGISHLYKPLLYGPQSRRECESFSETRNQYIKAMIEYHQFANGLCHDSHEGSWEPKINKLLHKEYITPSLVIFRPILASSMQEPPLSLPNSRHRRKIHKWDGIDVARSPWSWWSSRHSLFTFIFIRSTTVTYDTTVTPAIHARCSAQQTNKPPEFRQDSDTHGDIFFVNMLCEVEIST